MHLIPKDGVNPYADHPGFAAAECPLRCTVTGRAALGGVTRCGFGCEMTGGHCVPGAQCDGYRAQAAEQDRLAQLCKEPQ
jgi:hypothetical protein